MTRQTPVAERTIGDYLATLGSSQPAPGGGSVAGLVGALAAGLGQMVVSLTGKGCADSPQLAGVQEHLQVKVEELLEASEADERAYSGYLDANRLHRSTDAERATRHTAMQAALINAAEVPLQTAKLACELLGQLEPVVRHGSSHALSDAEIAVSLAHASVIAALVNVRVNVPLIMDARIAADLTERANGLRHRADTRVIALRRVLSIRNSS